MVDLAFVGRRFSLDMTRFGIIKACRRDTEKEDYIPSYTTTFGGARKCAVTFGKDGSNHSWIRWVGLDT